MVYVNLYLRINPIFVQIHPITSRWSVGLRQISCSLNHSSSRVPWTPSCHSHDQCSFKPQAAESSGLISQIRIIRVLLKTPLRVLTVYPCSRRICPKNATGFVAQRSRLHWHLKQASLSNEASFIFSGCFLDMIISVGFRVNRHQGGFLQVIGRS